MGHNFTTNSIPINIALESYSNPLTQSLLPQFFQSTWSDQTKDMFLQLKFMTLVNFLS